MFRTAACLAAFAGVLIVAPATPVAADPMQDCTQSEDANRRIEGCTRLLRTTRPRDRRNRALAYQNRSQGYFQNREFERAVADASRAILISPRVAAAWSHRADALRRLGNVERALADYGQAIKLEPDNAALYNNRARAFRASGDLERAIADYSEAIKRDPNFAQAYRNRAHVYRQQDKFKEALADYDAALKIDPNLPNVQEGRAVVQQALGTGRPFEDCIQEADPEKRVRGCTALISDPSRQGEPIRFFALHNRSYAHIQRGDLEKGIADASEALKLRPDSAFTYGNRADAYRRSERYDEAIADYTKAVELNPGYADGFTKRGYSWRKKGDLDKALADLTRALAINPAVAEVHVEQAAIHEEKRDYKQALTGYEAALKLDPHFASATAGATRVKAIIAAVAAATQGQAEKSQAKPEQPAQKPQKPDQQAARPDPTPKPDAAKPSVTPDPATVTGDSARLALVIGVDAYQNVRLLKAAVADAGSVAATLKELKFDVVLQKDLDYRGMSRSFADLEKKIKPGDTVFFFFSGHGVAVGGVNYLLPADAPAAKAGEESLIQDQAFDVPAVVHRIQRRGARTAILVLDACRNDPFESASDERSATEVRGLARVEPPEGVFMMYAAAARQVSYDRLNDNDTDPNSVFTRIFLEEIKKAGAKIRDVAKTTQTRVWELAKTANKMQRPAIYDEIIGELVLKP